MFYIQIPTGLLGYSQSSDSFNTVSSAVKHAEEQGYASFRVVDTFGEFVALVRRL